MRKAVITCIGALLVAAMIAGCSTVKEGAKSTYKFVFDDPTTATPVFPDEGEPLVSILFQMADEMNRDVNRELLPKESPIYVSRFRNIENASDDSTFGGVVANQLAVQLFKRGWRIAEGAPPEDAVEQFDHVAAQHVDDSMVIRDRKYNLQPSMLTGTYEVSNDSVLVTAKVIRMRDQLVTAAHAWSLPMTQRVRDLLNDRNEKESMEPTVKTTFD